MNLLKDTGERVKNLIGSFTRTSQKSAGDIKQRASEILPAITKTLRRALSYASEADYARDHIRIPEGDLAFWYYGDLDGRSRR